MVTTSQPVTVSEMTSPLGKRIREAVLVEVLAMCHTVRCDWHVPSEDELDHLKAMVDREVERTRYQRQAKADV